MARSNSDSTSVPAAAFPGGQGLIDYGNTCSKTLRSFIAMHCLGSFVDTNCECQRKFRIRAMVAHIGCNPKDYAIGPTYWYDCMLQPHHCQELIADSQVPIGQYCTTFGSTHPGGNLVLFADGHMQKSLDDAWLTAQLIHSGIGKSSTPIQLPKGGPKINLRFRLLSCATSGQSRPKPVGSVRRRTIPLEQQVPFWQDSTSQQIFHSEQLIIALIIIQSATVRLSRGDII